MIKLVSSNDQYICTQIDTTNNMCLLNKQTLGGEYISSDSEHIPDLRGWLGREKGSEGQVIFDQITIYCFTDMISNPEHENKYIDYTII